MYWKTVRKMSHSVVGRCIINPYLDNKNEIYKPFSREIGNFSALDGDYCRKECCALRTHGTSGKHQHAAAGAESQAADKRIVNQRASHDILNTELAYSYELSSTTRLAQQEALQKASDEPFGVINPNRQRERERIQRKMEMYYGRKEPAE